MDTGKRELTIEEMLKIVGGTRGEADQYLEHLYKKYGTSDINELRELVTKEEKKYFTHILNHKKGEPLKPYPD